MYSIILVSYKVKLNCKMYRKMVECRNSYSVIVAKALYGNIGLVWQHRLREMNTIYFLSYAHSHF